MFGFVNCSRIIDFFLNTVFVSAPEELYLVLFCLILMKQFDFLGSKNEGESRIKARDIIEIGVIVIILAALLRILTELNIDPNFRIVTLVFLMPILIIIVYKLWSIEDILKTFMFSFFSILGFMLIEFLYVSLVMYITKKPSIDLNGDAIVSFLWSLPERAVECVIITWLLIRKATFLKANFIKIIMDSKILKIIFSILFVFNISVFILLGKFVMFSNAFIKITYSTQLIIIGIITLIPIVNITGMLWSIYYVCNKEQYEKYIAKESLKNMVNDLVMFTRSEDSKKVDLVLKDIRTNIEDL